jgi:SCP-2 sterol transfer family
MRPAGFAARTVIRKFWKGEPAMESTPTSSSGKSTTVDTGSLVGTVIPDLAGYTGRLGIEVAGQMAAAFQVTDGRVELTAATDQPLDAVIVLRTADDLRQIIGGQLNAVVAALQARLALRGNGAVAIKVIRGLHASAVAAAHKEA